MRFLCLHGKGTSAKIFKSQTANFRALLPDSYEFDFIDGPYPDIAAAGIDLFYKPPYYSHYATPALADIKRGHQWLLQYIKDNGPYDGVMNFSQGCALVSSFLLYHQQQNPNAEPLFKVAIFICGGLPLVVASDLGVDVTEEARNWDESSKQQLMSRASSDAILREGSKRWGLGFDPFAEVDKKNVFGINFDDVPKEVLIKIPTVHIYGAKDPRFPASVTLAHFCDPGSRKTYDHGGGHDIPRRREVSEMMAELVEWSGMMADRWW